jgi:hypothetical protein
MCDMERERAILGRLHPISSRQTLKPFTQVSKRSGVKTKSVYIPGRERPMTYSRNRYSAIWSLFQFLLRLHCRLMTARPLTQLVRWRSSTVGATEVLTAVTVDLARPSM